MMNKDIPNNNILDTLFKIFKIKNKPNESIQDVKVNLLKLIIYILIILSTPVIIVSAILAVKLNQYTAAISYVIFFLPIIVAFILRKKAHYKLLTFLLLLNIYLLAIGDLYMYGIIVLAIPFFLTIFVLDEDEK